MIKVSYLVDAPFLGGAERYISRIATNLDGTRFEPSVIVRTPDDPHSALVDWCTDLTAEGIPVRSVPMDLPFVPHHAVGILRAISDLAPHVVHVNMPGPHDAQMGLLVPLARMGGARGVCVTEHLPMVETLWKRALIKRFSYHWVDCVMTVCHANVPYLTGKQFVPPEKVAVVHNALRREYGVEVDLDKANVRDVYNLPNDAPLILFVGNLLMHKGLRLVVQALAEMPETRWHLGVIGEGPEREVCEAVLTEKGLADRGTFLGRLPEREVERVMGVADVLTLPSRTEGMPYVILEAMASGIPVVATNVYGIPEMVEDGKTGLLVPPEDGTALGKALLELIQDENLRREFGQRARERFELYFTLDKQIAAIETLYRGLAGLDAGSR
jgi:glycosyltransferase involved in cell wall biosynthesis